jgi:hypothetical protein
VRFRNGAPAAKALAFKLLKHAKGYPELEALEGKGKKERPSAADALKAYRGPKLRIWEMQVKGPQLDQWPTPGHNLLYGNLTPDQISRANIPERLRIFAAAAVRRPLRSGELAPIEKLVTAKLDAGMKPMAALQLGFGARLLEAGGVYVGKVVRDIVNVQLLRGHSGSSGSKCSDHFLSSPLMPSEADR